jgi:hypothetical protein
VRHRLVDDPIVGHDGPVNEESLTRVNAFLAAVAERTEVGAVMEVTPAEVGRDLGFPDALSTARAVRALIARKRLEAAMGSYRLLNAEPVGASEKEAVGRAPRRERRTKGSGGEGARGEAAGRGREGLTYSDVGRAAVDRLIDLGREVATARAGLRASREEARDARQARDDAEQRARGLAERVRELEARAEMAEANLRTVLASARNKDVTKQVDVSDSEMEAILGILKTGDDPNAPASPVPGGDANLDEAGRADPVAG